MMPSNQALQVCYGTLPLILILIGIWLREQLVLRPALHDALERVCHAPSDRVRA